MIFPFPRREILVPWRLYDICGTSSSQSLLFMARTSRSIFFDLWGDRDQWWSFLVGWIFTKNRHSHIYTYTWNPNDPCFDWKRPCFGGLTFKNRGHFCSRYICIVMSKWASWTLISPTKWRAKGRNKVRVGAHQADFSHIYLEIAWHPPAIAKSPGSDHSIYLGVSKNSGFSPQIIHLFIGFSIIFTIHFGGTVPLLLVQHPFFWGGQRVNFQKGQLEAGKLALPT